MTTRTHAFVLTLALALAAPALAQHIPPHSNDPHPPANQPSYQLPSPLSRPGVPGYPGAAHSNDPHYTRTEPRPSWPTTTIPPSPPSASRNPLYQPHLNTSPRAVRRTTTSKLRKPRAASLAECYRKWDRGLRVSRANWQSTCRRVL